MAATSITDWIGAIMAVLGEGAAVIQYFRNSRQSSAIKAADKIDALLKNSNVKAVLHMIDWRSGTVMLGAGAGGAHPVFVNEQILYCLCVTTQCLVMVLSATSQTKTALRWKDSGMARNGESVFSADENSIRDAFDDFLGRLERIESLMKNGVITEPDFVDHFSYWLKLMDENAPAQPTHLSNHKRLALWSYIRAYEFSGVIKLFARFGKVRRSNRRRRRNSIPPRCPPAVPLIHWTYFWEIANAS